MVWKEKRSGKHYDVQRLVTSCGIAGLSGLTEKRVSRLWGNQERLQRGQ